MSNRQKWLYTVVLLLSTMFMAGANALRGSLLTSVIDFYSLTDFQQGLPAFVCNIGSMVAMLLALLLMKRMKKPFLLLLSLAAIAALQVPQYLTPGFLIFLALNALTGVGIGLLDTLSSASMADVHPQNKVMMNVLHACYGIGGILSPMIFASLLGTGMRWNLLFLVLAGAGAAVMLYAFPVSVKQASLPMYDEIQSAGKINLRDIGDFFRNRVLLTITLIMFMFGMFFGGFTNWLIRFVNEAYHSTLGDLSLSLVFLGVTAGRFITPLLPISPRAHLKFTGFVTWVLLSVALLTHSDVFTMIAACVSSVFCASAIPYSIVIACGQMQKNTLMASTIIFLAMYIGQAICSPIIGSLATNISLEAAMEFCYIFAALYSVCAIVGLRRKKS